jgi:predicted MFS family arabinose efflux permease
MTNADPHRPRALALLATGVSALRHRDFRLLFVGTFVSNAGSWMQKVATAWLVYQMTGSEAWLGIDAFASGIPTVLLLPWGGVVADRFDRRSLLIWTNLACAGIALLLAGLRGAGVLHVWHIVAASAASGVVQSVMVPASTSLLPAVVGDEDVPNAIALNSLQFNLSRVVGPAAGGAALVYLGAAWSFALNAVSFLVLSLALLFVRRVPPVPGKTGNVLGDLRGGLSFVLSRADVATMLLLVTLIAFLGAPVVSMLPAWVKSVLLRDASTYSLLLSCFGGGAVAAAAVSAVTGRHGPMAWLAAVALFIVGACQVLLARRDGLPLAMVVVAVAGFCFVGGMIRLGTALLLATPDGFRGRVSSLQQICFRAGQPAGALVAGFAARRFGLPTAFCTFGAAAILAAICLIPRHLAGQPRHRKNEAAHETS